MNTPSQRSFAPLIPILSLVVLLLSVALLAGYGWALVFAPDMADQITAIIVILGTILLSLLHPLAGFLVWLFLTPFAQFLPFDIHMPAGVPDLSFTRVVGGFLTIYLLAEIARGKRKLPAVTLVDVVIPIFVLALTVAAMRSANGWLAGIQAVFDSYIMPLLSYFIARVLIKTRSDYQALGWMLLAIASIIAILVMLEQWFGLQLLRVETTADFYTDDIRKVGALLGNPAYIALALNVILPFTFVLAAWSRSMGRRLLTMGILLVLLIGVFLTYNRSGWLGAVLGVGIILLFDRRLFRFGLPLIATAMIVGVLAWGVWQQSTAGQRLTAESPIDYRLEALAVGLDIAQSDPVLGVGWGSFGREAARRGFRVGHVFILPTPHNTYLNMLVSGGALLLGSFLALAMALAFTLWQRISRFRRRQQPVPIFMLAAIASYLAYFVSSVAFDNNFAYYATIVFWAIMGGAISLADARLMQEPS